VNRRSRSRVRGALQRTASDRSGASASDEAQHRGREGLPAIARDRLMQAREWAQTNDVGARETELRQMRQRVPHRGLGMKAPIAFFESTGLTPSPKRTQRLRTMPCGRAGAPRESPVRAGHTSVRRRSCQLRRQAVLVATAVLRARVAMSTAGRLRQAASDPLDPAARSPPAASGRRRAAAGRLARVLRRRGNSTPVKGARIRNCRCL